MYRFRYDAASGILSIVSSGFWTIEEADRYEHDLREQTREARRRHGRLLLVVDSRECPVQSPEVIARQPVYESLCVQTPRDRAAILLSSSLARMQVQRSMVSDQTRAFDTIAQAEAWLRSEAAPPPPRAG